MKKKIEIKAAVLNKIDHDLELKKIYHEGNLLRNQVLVKILYTGVCGSQLGEISGVKGKDKYLPHLLGHEATGKIVDISPQIKSLKKMIKLFYIGNEIMELIQKLQFMLIKKIKKLMQDGLLHLITML